MEQTGGLIAAQLYYRDSGPHADHFRNIFGGDRRCLPLLLRPPLLLQLLGLFLNLELALAKLGGFIILLIGQGRLFIPAQAFFNMPGFFQANWWCAVLDSNP